MNGNTKHQEPMNLDELFMLSYNFHEPVGIRLKVQHEQRTVTGVVEEMEDAQVMLAGQWYQHQDITGVIL